MSAFSSASASASTLICPPGAEWIKKAFHFMKPARETLSFYVWSQLPQSKVVLAQHAQNRATFMKDTFNDPNDLPDLINTSYAEVVSHEVLKTFPQGNALQAPFDRYTSFLMTFCKTLQQPMSLFRSQYLAIAKNLCPLILDYDASTLTPVKRGTVFIDFRQGQLNKLANETKGLRDRLVATELYVRRVELRKFVQWSDRMHFDVEGVRASIESLSRSLKLIAGENRALWRTAERSFPKTFSMGALILMHDMILVRLYIPPDGSSEGPRRHARLAASGGAYTSEHDQRMIDHQGAVSNIHAKLMGPPPAMPAPAAPGQPAGNSLIVLSDGDTTEEENAEPHVDFSDEMPWLTDPPAEPVATAEPPAPAEPTASAEPAAPAEPAALAEPTAPAELVDTSWGLTWSMAAPAAEPATPGEPTVPAGPVTVTEPAAEEEPVAGEELTAPPVAPPAASALPVTLEEAMEMMKQQRLEMEELARQAELARKCSLEMQKQLDLRVPSLPAEPPLLEEEEKEAYEPPTRRKRPNVEAASSANPPKVPKAPKPKVPASAEKGKRKR